MRFCVHAINGVHSYSVILMREVNAIVFNFTLVLRGLLQNTVTRNSKSRRALIQSSRLFLRLKNHHLPAQTPAGFCIIARA